MAADIDQLAVTHHGIKPGQSRFLSQLRQGDRGKPVEETWHDLSRAEHCSTRHAPPVST
jgi:hypothetical protein